MGLLTIFFKDSLFTKTIYLNLVLGGRCVLAKLNRESENTSVDE